MLNKEEIIDYFKLVNSHAKKELGQNFLINKNIVQDIVDKLEISPDDEVLEIGPGLGALTSTILTKNYKRFKVVEYDQKFVEFLAKSYEDKKIEITKNNILKERDYSFNKIIGNLPYYITSDIILKIALDYVNIKKGVFMVQKECLKRIVSKSGKDYNSLNVLLEYLFDIKTEIQVGRNNFFPVPNVDSVVFSITKKQEKNVSFAGFLYKIAKICFQNRRKTIFNNLSSTYADKEKLLEVLKKINLSEKTRAEELSVDDYVTLATELKNKFYDWI